MSNEVARSPHSGELLTPERESGEKEKAILSLHSSLSQLVEMQRHETDEKQVDWLPVAPPSPIISSTPPRSTSSNSLPLVLSTEEQEQQNQDVIVIDLTSSNPQSLGETVFVEVEQEPTATPILETAQFPKQPVTIRGRGSEVRSKLEELETTENKSGCPPNHQCNNHQGQIGAFANDISGFAKEFSSTKQSFDDQFFNSGGETVKQQLNEFANNLFTNIGSGPESREVGEECGGDFVSSCYERLLDTKIDKLQEEMRRLEAQYWGKKL